MEVDAAVAGAASRQQPLEAQLAGIMEQLLTDRVDAKEAIGSLEAVYHGAAERLRMLADEMQCQAATWHLVWCLYCNESGPAGIGGPDVQDAGDQRTYRQLLADKACMDPLLARVANVVAWLESLAADELSRQGVPRFADHDGVWIETRHQAGAGVVSELDPDAPGRQGKGLHVDNAKAEDRLMARLWQLVRAGRVRDARALCRQCGQPWRSASLGGGGGFGPLPVGLAAAQHDDEFTPELQAQDLAVELAAGTGTLRALWKWACLAVSARNARGTAAGGAAARFEAALYGVLCGDVGAMLPVCSTWEDACWAYCRAWLDLSTDQALGVSRQLPQDLVSGEVLMGVLQRCGLGSGTASSGDGAGLGASPVDGALSVVLGGQWPVAALLQPLPAAASGRAGVDVAGDFGAQLPASFAEVFDALQSSPDAAVRAASKEPLHQAQQLLVQGRLAGLTTHLHRWLVSPDPQPEAGTGIGASPSPLSTPWGGAGAGLLPAAGQVQDDGGEEAAGLPAKQLRMVAYATHLLLLLEALGEQAGDAEGSMEQVSGMREQLVVLYLAGLLEAGQLQLVPQYLPLTHPTNRRLLAHELLQLLTQQLNAATSNLLPQPVVDGGEALSAVDEQCAAVYCSLAAWLQACLVRQQQQEVAEAGLAVDGGLPDGAEASGLSNALRTGVAPDEARSLLLSYVDSCRLSPTHGPLLRARAARWLTYPVIYPGAADTASPSAARAAAESAAEGGTELADPSAMADLLRVVCVLCCEMALGDEVTAAAAQHLVESVLPADLDARALRVRDQLFDAAASTRQQPDADPSSMTDHEQEAEAAAAADAAEGAARDLEALVVELGAWRTYLGFETGVQAWRRRYEQLRASGGGAGQGEELASGARELLGGMVTELLQGGWLAPLADPSRAAMEAALATAVGGAAGCGSEVELVLSCLPDEWEAQAQAQRAEAGQASWASGDAPVPLVKGAKAFEAESQLRSALDSALHQERRTGLLAMQLVSADVQGPDGAEGYLRVTLSCRPSVEAWHCLVDTVVAILQGSLAGLPSRLLLVNMQAGRATSAAVCRRCCLGKVVLHCSQLRQALVELGGDGSDGEELVRLLACSGADVAPGFGAEAGPRGLLEVLSRPMLQQVLKAEADTLVAVMQQQQQWRA